MNKVIGVLAHVDAGKTTLSEQILYHAGVLRHAGRVDHRDTFFDLHTIERERGITVFTDQAVFDIENDRYYWLDTPGHADLCAQMEQVIPVLDYALIIVSCSEGIESHTETVWNLLKKHAVPTMFFVNKCDRPDADKAACLKALIDSFSSDIVSAENYAGEAIPETLAESIAERNDALLEAYFAGDCSNEDLTRELIELVAWRSLFPVFFGSALHDRGIAEFLNAFHRITRGYIPQSTNTAFSGRAFKVRRDERGTRRLFVRVLSGTLRVKDSVQTSAGSLQVSELTICKGGKFVPVQSVSAGDIVCISGMPSVRIGDLIGTGDPARIQTDSVPLIEVSVTADRSVPSTKLLEVLRELEDEDPTLCVRTVRTGDVCVRVMGAIHTEILARLIHDRFGIEVTFGKPHVLYMETIQAPAIGIGHYEPLKHYAEVVLRLVPAPRGTGINFVSRCHVDDLLLNWQRLIETHVFERTYPGVLTGAPLTDVTVELLAGRAHLKHTEGGDFREATCRAIRCALMNAKNVLLEPVVRVHMRFPEELYGRVKGDLYDLRAAVDDMEQRVSGYVSLTARCALSRFMDYPETYRALTHGRGIMSMSADGYEPAENTADVVATIAYDPYTEDSPDSVFCSHGAGHIVSWKDVPACAHCTYEL